MADNRFTEVQIPGKSFRGFDAHNDTRIIDAQSPSDMGGPERTVLRPGATGTYDSCRQWLNHAERTGATLLGFIHDETACKYQVGQTHTSMSLSISNDDALSWNASDKSSPAPMLRQQTRMRMKAIAPLSMDRKAITMPTASAHELEHSSPHARCFRIRAPAIG